MDATSGDAPLPLPPLELRTGGAHFVDDGEYVARAERDVRALVQLAGMDARTRVLDWGCGAGRLAVGLRSTGAAFATYHGVDVQARLVEWAASALGSARVTFQRVDAPNDRYNPEGRGEHDIGAEDGVVDVVHAYSVFSHLHAEDAAAYLCRIARALGPRGRAVVTAFVEEDVPAWEVNPPGYGPLPWSGPLHCVRYDGSFFAGLVAAAGLTTLRLEHGGETDGQSRLVLAHRPGV